MPVVHPELSPQLFEQRPELLAAARRNMAWVAAQNLDTHDAFSTVNVMDKDRPIAIIGGGHSLKQRDGTGKIILESLDTRRDIIKVIAHSAHQLLNDGKLRDVDAVVCNLPEQSAQFIKPQGRNIAYLIASQCDSDVFDAVTGNGKRPYIWHPYLAGETQDTPGQTFIGPGSTAATAALSLFAAGGHTRFEFYGVDSSTEYIYDAGLQPGAEVSVTIGGRTWSTTRNFWNQTLEMKQFLEQHPEISVRFHGDTLNAVMFNDGIKEPKQVLFANPVQQQQTRARPRLTL